MLEYQGTIKDYIREHLQIGDAMPSVEVRVWNNSVLLGTPKVLHNVKSISWDRREDALAHEVTFVVEDEDGIKSPYFDPSKFPSMVDVYSGGYQYCFYPENIVQVWLGYGEERIQIFTGIIDKVKISEESAELEVTCRDMMKQLIDQPIVPTTDTKDLVYEYNPKAPLLISAVIGDLINKAGLVAEVEDSKFVDGSVYTIEADVTFELGTKYMDAIKQLTDSIGYKIHATPLGSIWAGRDIYPSLNKEPDVILYDYVNLTSGELVIDNQDARDTIIIASNTGWEEFENAFLKKWLRPTFRRAAKVTIPWADTPKKRKLAAQSAFAMMMRSTQRLTVGCVAHPALEVGDVAEVSARVSQSSGKFRITGIKTVLDGTSFTDQIELDKLVDATTMDAVPTNRFFGMATATWSDRDFYILDKDTKNIVIDMKGSFAEAKMTITDLSEDHFGTNIRLVMNTGGGFTVSSDFDFNAMMTKADPDGENDLTDLQARGFSTYAQAVAFKKYVEQTKNGKVLYVSSGNRSTNTGFVAVIKCSTSTRIFKNDLVSLNVLNFGSIAGMAPKTRATGWKIKSICF
jgi:hypothetical protein